ncbi:nitroreductase family protein [Massiliimalia timonensis]|uniref:nitroreductase family protein n=1 Tax=Massiliimalia timonensis TaxID=1987501 RepID=UPI00189FB06F|nr:nitroreductase family protein [Massiliimalia timonensis]
MELIEAVKNRHSVRRYQKKPIEAEMLSALQEEINACNQKSGLHIQLVTGEPNAFRSLMAHYGNFSGVTNYIALVGTKGKHLEELCGYYGERLVLNAQQLGLNTCWAAMTYKKVPGAFVVRKGERLVAVIALGYGETQGTAHKTKSIEAVSNAAEDSPKWFQNGVELALLAPTAVNQQKFYLKLDGENRVTAKAGMGFYSKIDLGIVKYHFEIGADKKNFIWA